jgi:S-adenosylmethionine-diacylglycerol 3-amino-3-carboxypropyl transferase
MHSLEPPLELTGIRYGQVWEDADMLLAGLDVRPGDVCLSIASAGDNALALLTRDPARVIAIDVNPAQLACLELRIAAYRELSHPQLLELVGSRPSQRRTWLYRRCRVALSPEGRRFWDALPDVIERGIGYAGRFERYLETFRTRVLPLAHGRRDIDALLEPRARADREAFYRSRWNTPRWRLLFRMFFSRLVMGLRGRAPGMFRHVRGPVADRVLDRTRHGLTALDPSDNPYLHWMLTGAHRQALPCALRAEHFERIRANLDRLEWRCQSVEAFVTSRDAASVTRYNLSDIFEYVSALHHQQTIDRIADSSTSGTRLAYWNFLCPRRCLEPARSGLRSLAQLAAQLHQSDRTFFYSEFVLEEVA